MSAGPKTATAAKVIDYLAESRFARHRRKKQEHKAFTHCQRCSTPLISKWGTLRGTNDAAKAKCKACKITRTGCQHLRRCEFTLADGQTITMCPDCTRFDQKRKNVLKQGRTQKRTLTTWVYGERHHIDIDNRNPNADGDDTKDILDKEAYKVSWPHGVQDKQAGLMYRGHETLPYSIGSCFMLLDVDVVKEADVLVSWFRNEAQRQPIAPPVQRMVFVNRTFSRTCISASPYSWSQQTGWYVKRKGVVTGEHNRAGDHCLHGMKRGWCVLCGA